jgi:TPR repeat protein
VTRILSAALFTAALAAPHTVLAAGGMEEAMQSYEDGNFVHAETRLRALAGEGDARAAEILGFMYAFGPAMYPGVPRDLRSAIQWFDIAGRGGRPIGQYMVCALSKQMGAAAAAPQRCVESVAAITQAVPR